MKNHPEIQKFTTIWMETVRDGAFGLSNTNKLVRFYPGATGLKTGFTSGAGYCLSATAQRDGMELIAVVMGCPNPKDRFAEAAQLLNYGFANCKVYEHGLQPEELLPVPTKKGVKKDIKVEQSEVYKHLFLKGEDLKQITWEVTYRDDLEAPVKIGEQAGKIQYFYEGKEIGQIPLCVTEEVERAGFLFYLERVWSELVGVEGMVFD